MPPAASKLNLLACREPKLLFPATPPDATSGPITILTPHGNVTSAASFTVIPLPSLSTSRSEDGTLRLTWPANPLGFVLETSFDLNSSASWQRPTETPIQVGELWELKLQPASENQFFRLPKP